jgi:galactoside O-acetyltransferase
MFHKPYILFNKVACRFLASLLRLKSKKLYIDILTFRASGIRNISIGDNFNSCSSLKLFADNGRLTIGESCTFNTNVFIGASGGTISIGSNVLIGPNVVLRSSNHMFRSSQILIRDQGHLSGSIIIEDDVWICANCVITPDVTLRKGSVIGAGSVVTSDTNAYGVYVGSPAKLISYRKP